MSVWNPVKSLSTVSPLPGSLQQQAEVIHYDKEKVPHYHMDGGNQELVRACSAGLQEAPQTDTVLMGCLITNVTGYVTPALRSDRDRQTVHLHFEHPDRNLGPMFSLLQHTCSY